MKLIYKTSTQITILLIIIILSSFFWWQIKFSTKKIKIDVEDSIYKPALNIEGAKYSGFSKNGQKYSISASLISERPNNTKVLNMTRPSASIISKNQSVFISSNKGELNLENKKIILNDNVTLIDKKMNYKLLSESLNANLNKGEFYSSSSIKIIIPSGIITSEKFVYKKDENKVLFLGKTKLVLLK